MLIGIIPAARLQSVLPAGKTNGRLGFDSRGSGLQLAKDDLDRRHYQLQLPMQSDKSQAKYE